MLGALAASLVIAAGEPCDEFLQHAVLTRMPDGDVWSAICLGSSTLEISRFTDEGRRVRVIELGEVSGNLRAEVAVMAAQALLRPAASVAIVEPLPPPARRPLPAREGEASAAIVAPDPTWLDFAWSHDVGAAATPAVDLRGAVFWGSGAWLVGGFVGVDWRFLRGGLLVLGNRGRLFDEAFELVSPQLSASLAVVCGVTERWRGCLRGEASGGVLLTTYLKLPWSPILSAGGAVELGARVGPFWLGAAVRLGMTTGTPNAVDPKTFVVGPSVGLSLQGHLAATGR